jgi:hypothetical protein
MRLVLKSVNCTPLIEEEWLKESPDLLVTPVLGHNVSGIVFTDMVKRQCVITEW